MTAKSGEETLYILLRTDMASMTPGRAAAQSSHITSAFTKDTGKWVHPEFDAYLRWTRMTDDAYGTAIVLGGSIEEIQQVLDKAKQTDFCHGNRTVNDPTYAVWDGDVCHLIDVEVGGYFFTEDRNLLKESGITSSLELF